MGKIYDFIVEESRKLVKGESVKARDYYEANKKLGIKIKRISENGPGRPRKN